MPCGQVVRQLRGLNKLTVAQLSDQTKAIGHRVAPRKIQQIEASEPTRYSILTSVAEALNVAVEKLLFDAEETSRRLMHALYLDRTSNDPDSVLLQAHLFSDDLRILVVGNPATIPFAGEFNGLQGAIRFFDLYFSLVQRSSLDPQPSIDVVAVNPISGVVVAELRGDIVRLRANPNRILTCKVKCTFRFENGKLAYFEDLFDTAAWEKFLGDTADADLRDEDV